jgi:hypothetical protein
MKASGCSFDTILRIYGIRIRLSTIWPKSSGRRHVRVTIWTPQCGGLFAISLGLSRTFRRS